MIAERVRNTKKILFWRSISFAFIALCLTGCSNIVSSFSSDATEEDFEKAFKQCPSSQCRQQIKNCVKDENVSLIDMIGGMCGQPMTKKNLENIISYYNQKTEYETNGVESQQRNAILKLEKQGY
ncbi:hypothetical protein [Acinetobacter nosocomialis]|uniref:hypothetical protein n=1 Tax=Acinetobacter nosocomialis TaxID=106654 RepID=UPI001F348084|nr:hypothetical protein [Acinetobacter nosocomialis]MCE7534210.1 hypothetical protein [Acinetobacter nosocomialis]